MRSTILTAIAFGALATPAYAFAGPEWRAEAGRLDLLWILVCACLVFLMQGGFLLVEAGTVRSKNSISVAFRNLVDALLAVLLYASVGFTVMYGVSAWGIFGVTAGEASLDATSPEVLAFFLFNAAFCATATTIFSGAVAERMSLAAFAPTTIFVAALVYPVFGHWAWGAGVNGENQPLLAAMGFYDFAGATVVHSVGAWVALAGAIAVGPRLGRYSEDGRAVQLHGHSKVFSGLGLLCLMVGWFGFNGGSALTFDGTVALILVNTLIAGAAGGVMSACLHYFRFPQFNPDRLITGVIAGLVAVTAAANIVSPLGALLLGAMGGAVNSIASRILARLGIDDVVGAIASHGAAGAWGTVALAFVAAPEALPLKSQLDQAGVQILGVAAAFLWAFPLSLLWFKFIGRFIALRVSEEDEQRGLNAVEHGAQLGVEKLGQSVRELTSGEADLSLRVAAESGDDTYLLAEDFNKLLAQLEAKEIARRALDEQTRLKETAHNRKEADRLERERRAFEEERRIVGEISEFIGRAAGGELGGRLSLEDKAGVLGEIADGVNRLIDGLSGSIGAIAHSAESIHGACASLAEVSGDLRQRSASQIDSVQSVTFRLSTMADAANQSSELAENALGVATETREVSDVVQSGVERIEVAMREIECSAGAIAPVVAMIEAIAFKTNLLAVNAAIEAARAGAAGKSFAVVAHEVRSLAGNAQEFADEIGALVKTSLAAVHKGVEVVNETSGRVRTINTTADRVSEQINNIHSASVDQRDKLNSLYDAVAAIAEVSSGNARLASEAASASDKLAGEGRKLVDGVKNFSGYTIDDAVLVSGEDEENSDDDLSIQLF